MTAREEMQSIAQEIVRSYEDRISGEAERKRTTAQEISQRKSDVSAMLKGFDDAHATMSEELRAKLTGDERERRQAAAEELRQRKAVEEERRRTTAQEISQRKSDVSAMLKEFAQGDAQRKSEVTGMLSEFHKGDIQRKSEVSTMLKGFREEQAGVRDEWQKLTATMQSKRGGVAVAVKPPEVVAPPPSLVEIAEEEAIAKAGVAEITPELMGLRHRVFDYLANHPDGTRLVELEQEFGVARILAARIIKSLVGDNRVEKRGLLYFAI